MADSILKDMVELARTAEKPKVALLGDDSLATDAPEKLGRTTSARDASQAANDQKFNTRPDKAANDATIEATRSLGQNLQSQNQNLTEGLDSLNDGNQNRHEALLGAMQSQQQSIEKLHGTMQDMQRLFQQQLDKEKTNFEQQKSGPAADWEKFRADAEAARQRQRDAKDRDMAKGGLFGGLIEMLGGAALFEGLRGRGDRNRGGGPNPPGPNPGPNPPRGGRVQRIKDAFSNVKGKITGAAAAARNTLGTRRGKAGLILGVAAGGAALWGADEATDAASNKARESLRAYPEEITEQRRRAAAGEEPLEGAELVAFRKALAAKYGRTSGIDSETGLPIVGAAADRIEVKPVQPAASPSVDNSLLDMSPSTMMMGAGVLAAGGIAASRMRSSAPPGPPVPPPPSPPVPPPPSPPVPPRGGAFDRIKAFASDNADKLKRVKALPVLGSALTAYEAGSIITDEKMSGSEKAQAGANLAGGLAGAAVGAKAGAALGAFGGPIGAGAGTLIGGTLGYLGGEELIDRIGTSVQDAVTDSGVGDIIGRGVATVMAPFSDEAREALKSDWQNNILPKMQSTIAPLATSFASFSESFASFGDKFSDYAKAAKGAAGDIIGQTAAAGASIWGGFKEAIKTVKEGYAKDGASGVIDSAGAASKKVAGGFIGAGNEIEEGIALAGKRLGAVSAKYESSGRGVATVSTGAGDHGGVSYGKHQLASNNGSMAKFLASEQGQPFAKQFAGMKPGTKEFNERYKQVASTQGEQLAQAQHDYVSSTHFGPMAQRLKDSIGLDVTKRGRGVQEAVFSTSVQYGPNSKIVEQALKGKNVASMSDKEIIAALQDYKQNSAGSYFKSSSPAVQRSIAQRAANEKKDLLAVDAATAKVGTDTVLAKTATTAKVTTTPATNSPDIAKEANPVIASASAKPVVSATTAAAAGLSYTGEFADEASGIGSFMREQFGKDVDLTQASQIVRNRYATNVENKVADGTDMLTVAPKSDVGSAFANIQQARAEAAPQAANVASSHVSTQAVSDTPAQRAPHESVQKVMMLDQGGAKRENTKKDLSKDPRLASQSAFESRSIHASIDETPAIVSDFGLTLLNTGFI